MLDFQGHVFIQVRKIYLGGAAFGGAAKGDCYKCYKDISLEVQHQKYSEILCLITYIAYGVQTCNTNTNKHNKSKTSKQIQVH